MEGAARWLAVLVCLGTSVESNAQGFPSPESALQAFQTAHAQRNLDAWAATIDFRHEAIESLKKQPSQGSAADEAQVGDTAARLEAEFRQRVEQHGFRGINWRSGEQVAGFRRCCTVSTLVPGAERVDLHCIAGDSQC